MDATQNGRSAIMTIVIIIGFIVLMAVPSVITYIVVSPKHTTDTGKINTPILNRIEYNITKAISTSDPVKEKASHENLQNLIDRISTTVSDYESLSKDHL